MWLLLGTAAHAQTTWTVPDDLPDLAAAYTSPYVVDGDTIDLFEDQVVGSLFVGRSLRIRGQGTTTVELVGNPGLTVVADTTLEALTVTGAVEHASVSGVTLTLIDASLIGGTSFGNGGCVSVISGALVATDTTFEGCVAGQGGAVYLESASLACVRCSFVGSFVTDGTGDGGAVLLEGAATASFVDSAFASNQSAAWAGGAVSISGGSSVSLIGGAFVGNTAATLGGAIAVREDGTLTATGTTFSGNSATDGGAIGCDGTGIGCDIVLTDTLFDDDEALGSGGHLFVLSTGTVTVDGGRLARGRSVGDGGGVYVGGGRLTVTDTVIEGNQTDGDGGGIRTVSGDVTLVRVRACDNVANDAGGAADLEGVVRVHELTAIGNEATKHEAGALRVAGDTVIDFSTFVGNRSGNRASAIYATDGVAIVAGSVFTDHATVAVGGAWTAHHTAGYAQPGGNWGPLVTVIGEVVPTEAPLQPVVGCTEPILRYGGELVDVAGSTDPDGTRGDVGATGGPDAEPALWDDSDADTVPAMWDCDPINGAVSPVSPEIQDGLDNDCDGVVDTGVSAEPEPATPEDRSIRWRGSRRAVGCGCGHTDGGTAFFAWILAGGAIRFARRTAPSRPGPRRSGQLSAVSSARPRYPECDPGSAVGFR